MQTFSKLLVGISLASAALAAPQPGLDINIHLGDYGVSSGREGFQPENEVDLLKVRSPPTQLLQSGLTDLLFYQFDEFKIEKYLKPVTVGNLKWGGPWMMFNGENVHLPGVVSKPNTVFVESPYEFPTIEAINGMSPWPTFSVESFWATRLFDPKTLPLPHLAASLICEHPGSEPVAVTQVKPVKSPGTPIKFDNWPRVCTRVTFRIGYLDEKTKEVFPAQFSMDDLRIM